MVQNIISRDLLGAGGAKRTFAADGVEYGERLGFVDLVEPKRARTPREAADELRAQLLGRSSAERVQEDTFRNPFVSFLYFRRADQTGRGDAAAATRIVRGGRGDAAAATRIVRGDASPRDASPPRPRRG